MHRREAGQTLHCGPTGEENTGTEAHAHDGHSQWLQLTTAVHVPAQDRRQRVGYNAGHGHEQAYDLGAGHCQWPEVGQHAYQSRSPRSKIPSNATKAVVKLSRRLAVAAGR